MKGIYIMRKSNNSYFNPTLVRIVGILLFISTLVVQGKVTKMIADGMLPQQASGGINGIVSQIQVLISVAMVVMIPKKGIYTSIVMCIVNSLYILFFGVILSHNPGAAPGVLSPLITLIVCTLIHYYSMKLFKAQEKLEKQNEDLIETNDVISKEGERLSRIVYNDNLTGLYNKDMLAVKIGELLNNEDKTPFTVVYLEINDFDSIVKSGKENADMILTTFAYRLHNFCGNSGITARVGTSRFALIITGQRNRESVTSYISDLTAEVCEPISLGGSLKEITVTSGVTHFPRDGKTAEELMANADNAVQYAVEKNSGSVYFFS